MTTKHILLTGGAGFIASHIVDAYVAARHTVVILDNLSTGKREQIHSEAVFVQGDIRDTAFLEQIIREHGPFNVINHHAAQKSIGRSMDEPREDAEINILGTLNLLELARNHRIKQFIFASSGGAIYGPDSVLPTSELSPIQALSPYGISKAAIELYLGFYQTQGLITQSLRYANVYGPRQDPAGEAGVVAILAAQIIHNQPLTVIGDGEQTRDFVYVGDVARVNLRLLDHPTAGAWNIATGQETSINQLVATLIDAAAQPRQPSITYLPPRPGDQRRSVLDPTLARKELKFTPETSLQSGMQTVLTSLQEKNEHSFSRRSS